LTVGEILNDEMFEFFSFIFIPNADIKLMYISTTVTLQCIWSNNYTFIIFTY